PASDFGPAPGPYLTYRNMAAEQTMAVASIHRLVQGIGAALVSRRTSALTVRPYVQRPAPTRAATATLWTCSDSIVSGKEGDSAGSSTARVGAVVRGWMSLRIAIRASHALRRGTAPRAVGAIRDSARPS